MWTCGLIYGWNPCSRLSCIMLQDELDLTHLSLCFKIPTEQRHFAWSLTNQLQEQSGSEQTFKCCTIKKNTQLVYLPKQLKAAVFHKYVLICLIRNSLYVTKSNNIPLYEHPSVLLMKTLGLLFNFKKFITSYRK